MLKEATWKELGLLVALMTALGAVFGGFLDGQATSPSAAVACCAWGLIGTIVCLAGMRYLPQVVDEVIDRGMALKDKWFG